MTKIRTTSSADVDIVECAIWFEQQTPGLGVRFLDAVDDALDEIALRPIRCPTLILPQVTWKAQLRWLSVGRFPHIAIFEATDVESVVYAVVHPHRDLESVLSARVGRY